VVGALEKAEKIGFEPSFGHVLKKGDHRFGCRAEFGGKAGADALDSFGGKAVKVGLQRTQITLSLKIKKNVKPRQKDQKITPIQPAGGAI